MTTAVPSANTHFVFTEDGAMLLNLSTGRFFGLNATAAAMWSRLAAGIEVEAVAAELAAEWNVSRGRLFTDICRLVKALRSHGVLAEERPQI